MEVLGVLGIPAVRALLKPMRDIPFHTLPHLQHSGSLVRQEAAAELEGYGAINRFCPSFLEKRLVRRRPINSSISA